MKDVGTEAGDDAGSDYVVEVAKWSFLLKGVKLWDQYILYIHR